MIQMLELTGRYFKAAIIKVLKDLKENEGNNEQMGNRKGQKFFLKTQIETLGLKSTMSKMRSSLMDLTAH